MGFKSDRRGESSNKEGVDENGRPRKKMIVEDGKVDEELDEKEPILMILEPFRKDQLIHIINVAISKFPELIKVVKWLANENPAHREITILGLGLDIVEETLISVFNKYGEIEYCFIKSDTSRRTFENCAFILFKHRNGARKALKQPQKNIGNRSTFCHLSSIKHCPAPPPSYTKRQICVQNVFADTDPQKLTEFFARYGDIEAGPIGLDNQTGKFMGSCFYVYKSIESFRKALETPDKIFDGKTLRCCKALHIPIYKPDIPQHQFYHHDQGHMSIREEIAKLVHESGLISDILKEPFPGSYEAFADLSHESSTAQALTLGFNPGFAAPSRGPCIREVSTSTGFNPVVRPPSPNPQALTNTGFNSAMDPSIVRPLTYPGFNPIVRAPPSLNPKASTNTGLNSANLNSSIVRPLASPGFNPIVRAPSLNPKASTNIGFNSANLNALIERPPRFNPVVRAPPLNSQALINAELNSANQNIPPIVQPLTSPEFNLDVGALSLIPKASTNIGFNSANLNALIERPPRFDPVVRAPPLNSQALTNPRFNSANPNSPYIRILTSPEFNQDVRAPSMNPSKRQALAAFLPSQGSELGVSNQDGRSIRYNNHSKHAPNGEETPIQEPGWREVWW